MIERDHIELKAHLDRLEQKVQKDSLLIQLLVEQNRSLQEQLVHVSVRSLQCYRSEGILPYKMMHKKAYYTKEGVMDFLNKHVVSFDQEEVALYFAKLGKTA